MPKRSDIKSILVIGAGPIVIGQACEFDYSGTQGIKALKEEGYRTILINSNPATIMTDPDIADCVYIEPITVDFVESIIRKEKPDAILPTLGGQTALNTALELDKKGVLKKYNVELIGATVVAINKAEDRKLFKQAMDKIGLACPKSFIATNIEQALKGLDDVGLPAIIRPSLTLGGSGGGVANTIDEYKQIVSSGLDASPIKQIQIDQSIIGWKEFEMEVVRDKVDNCIIICSIENIDPMGVHTGDSITVAPALTLTDKEYQKMREASFAIMREIGVDTGGSNVQFAINPQNGEMLIIEMNPRVSRSSALASKATGFPIAKVAAKLAIGYTLDEIRYDIAYNLPECVNIQDYKEILDLKSQGISKKDILKHIHNKNAVDFAFYKPIDTLSNQQIRQKIFPASFEPTIDYIVVKMPKFAFKKFGIKNAELGTQMQSIGESMAIGRTFEEAFLKALNSLEGTDSNFDNLTKEEYRSLLSKRIPERCLCVMRAIEEGIDIQEICDLTKIDKWFVERLQNIVIKRMNLKQRGLSKKTQDISELITKDEILELKQLGFRDAAIREYLGIEPDKDGLHKFGDYRKKLGVKSVFKAIDTCSGEFNINPSYFYSTFEKGSYKINQDGDLKYLEPENESVLSSSSKKRKIVVIGSRPNTLGQGIEFDYSCVQACFAIKEMGYESIMINCNPETVSTDYDTSDRLYFEPLVFEYVQAIIENEMCSELYSIYQNAMNNNFNILFSYNGQQIKCSTKDDFVKFLSQYIGVIVQLGGQTPLKLCKDFNNYAIPVLGTSVKDIFLADHRGEFEKICHELNLNRPKNYYCTKYQDIVLKAEELNYQFVIRPSSVLGGRGMKIIQTREEFEEYINFEGKINDALLDEFLTQANEFDLDLIRDSSGCILICGLLEHIEYAGVHSGDSACSIPTRTVDKKTLKQIEIIAKNIADRLNVVGLMNLQLAIKENKIYIIEVNPRASRTVPFTAKAVGLGLSKLATKVMCGELIENSDEFKDYGSKKKIDKKFFKIKNPKLFYVKEAVFSFEKLASSEIILGPEMKSTGEVMGIDKFFEVAYLKAIIATKQNVKTSGNVFVSVSNLDKTKELVNLCKNFEDIGFNILATTGTATFLRANNIKVHNVHKVNESDENVVKMIKNGQIDIVINTTSGLKSIKDSFSIRRATVAKCIPYATNIESAKILSESIKYVKNKKINITDRIYKINNN